MPEARIPVPHGPAVNPKTGHFVPEWWKFLHNMWIRSGGGGDITGLFSTDIGSSVQAWDAQLDDIAALAVTDSNFIVADGANWVAESGAVARTSLDAEQAFTDAGAKLVTSTGSPTARSLSNRFADFVNVKDHGGVGDGVADDTTAVTDAEAEGKHIVVPDGTYDTTTTAANLGGPFLGFGGRIRDSANDLRGPFFTAIKAAPSSLGGTSQDTSFNGDISNSIFQVEHRLTGVATLGQPTTGYVYTQEAYPYFLRMKNESGHNQGTADNVGRTAAVGFQIRGTQAGQGDFPAFNALMHVNATKSGSTDVLANPAASVINGQVTAGQAGVYLNPGEFLCDDQGNDCAAAGWVVRLKRTVGTAAKKAFWYGYRAQSGEGSVNPDAAFSAQGDWDRGLDFGPATFSSDQAAICLKTNQRIYGNVTASDARFSDAFGDDFILFGSALDGWNFVVNGTSRLQIVDDQITGLQPFKADQGYKDSNGTAVLGDQGAAVADASGGATIDAEARTAINALLARMRTHGAIAT